MRKAVISSGLPLTVALRAHGSLEVFGGLADSYSGTQGAFPALVAVVREIEEWARSHATAVIDEMPEAAKLDAIRAGWLGGIPLQALTAINNDAKDITRDLYGYHLPWIVHAASQQLRNADEAERADALAKIALLLELGVPSDLAARIFLAGVRSRAAATELGTLDVTFGTSVSQISNKLRDVEFTDAILSLVSPATAAWLALLVEEAVRDRHEPLPEFPAFTVPGTDNVNVLHARRLGAQIFLASVDGQTRISVQPTHQLPFDRVANDPRVAFVRSGQTWRLHIRDPHLQK
jgi:hypothetical protein